jgi:hypothetical protein
MSQLFFSFVALMLMVSCTSFSGVQPQSHGVTAGMWVNRVESLQPTVEWKPAQGDNITYDLVVYEAIREDSNGPNATVPGPRVYYRKGIMETSHRIETQLKPDTQYFWSVRVRQGQTVSHWSTYHYNDLMQVQHNAPFTFKTPRDEK